MSEYLDIAGELKKIMKHESDGDTKRCLSSGNSPEEPRKETGITRYQRKNWNYPERNTIKNQFGFWEKSWRVE